MAGAVDRRRFLASLTAPLAWPASSPAFAAEFPVRFRKASPYQALLPFVEPGSDEFAVEKEAAGIEAELRRMRSTRTLPLDSGFRGASPMPLRYRIRAGIAQAEFGAKEDFLSGLRKWLDSLGDIRRMDFYALSGGRIRYEVASSGAGGLQYRTGSWRARWRDGKLTSFAPLEETLVTSPKALFEDVTGQLFGETPSFQEQLTRGVPYWRSRLDLASGITVFGNNGIAVGDADGDGWDEVYVCQPGGLPNRLYRRAANGGWQDVTERAGVGVLDDTASALFLDLRNQGVQDLIVLTTSMP
ncbi:MAG: VCBS repeat-containing protein, partial [Acidobacteria bacterium]|nr:VCBS repeat-containing protein [Acidobacteriota bacterium]